MGFRTFSPEELEKLFEIYRTAPLNKDGSPSINYTAEKGQIERDTVERLRDRYGWEERRLKILEGSLDRADAKREKEDAKRIRLYQELEKAGLNFKVGQVKDGKLEITLSELITLSKHVQVLMGNPDSRRDQTGCLDLRIRCRDMQERKRLLAELAEDLEDLRETVEQEGKDRDAQEDT